MAKFKVGLIGLGTVGTGVYKTLQNFNDVEIVKIAVKNINKKRDIENFDESLKHPNKKDIEQVKEWIDSII